VSPKGSESWFILSGCKARVSTSKSSHGSYAVRTVMRLSVSVRAC
jgi:hypothetical protein